MSTDVAIKCKQHALTDPVARGMLGKWVIILLLGVATQMVDENRCMWPVRISWCLGMICVRDDAVIMDEKSWLTADSLALCAEGWLASAPDFPLDDFRDVPPQYSPPYDEDLTTLLPDNIPGGGNCLWA